MITNEIGRNTCIVAIALDHSAEEINHVPRINLDRLQLLNQGAYICNFFLYELLQFQQFLPVLLFVQWSGSQSIKPECDCVQRLDHSIVQIARNPSSLHRGSTRTQAAEKVHVKHRRRNLQGELLQEA